MQCFNPNQGYKALLPSGKLGFTTKLSRAFTVNSIPQRMCTPCRKCEACRFTASKHWCTRLVHEAQYYGIKTAFITLTYQDMFVPQFGALNYRDVQLFMKRFRDRIPVEIRYFGIGEYGDLNLRPHYHAIIFGWDFPDKYVYEVRNGHILYRSPLLESVWTIPRGNVFGKEYNGASIGYSSIGEVNAASTGYVARYSMKKLIGASDRNLYVPDTGEFILNRYERYDFLNDRIVDVPSERSFISNGGGKSAVKGGIGKRWAQEFGVTDLYRKGYVHMPDGRKAAPPPFYNKIVEEVAPEVIESFKKSREDYVSVHVDSLTPDLIRQQRECFLSKLKLFKRQSGRIYNGT